jgi:hypothetical protein
MTRLGFWNRLAVAFAVPILVVVPFIILAGTTDTALEIPTAAYQSCIDRAFKAPPGYHVDLPWSPQSKAEPFVPMTAETPDAYDQFGTPIATADAGATAAAKACDARREQDRTSPLTTYGVALAWTALGCLVVYLLLWLIAATAQWVWRGRTVQKTP